MLVKLLQDHPHMKFIVNEDALGSNAPHIADLEEHSLQYILGVKEGEHKLLFQYVDQTVESREAVELAFLLLREYLLIQLCHIKTRTVYESHFSKLYYSSVVRELL